jgi:hypothetical protein
MTPSRLIAFLNSLTCGDLDALAAKLEEAREVCRDIGEIELADKLGEARKALLDGDLRTYRKRVETVVACLGHVRSKHRTPSGSTI